MQIFVNCFMHSFKFSYNRFYSFEIKYLELDLQYNVYNFIVYIFSIFFHCFHSWDTIVFYQHTYLIQIFRTFISHNCISEILEQLSYISFKACLLPSFNGIICTVHDIQCLTILHCYSGPLFLWIYHSFNTLF